MKALVTGGTGFVGSHLVRRLLERNWEVRCLVRAASRLDNLKDLPVEFATGDLRDVDSIRQAVRGADAVYHCAADYRLWCADPREMYESNVNGSRHVMQAALDERVERVDYTSTVGALGLKDDGTAADEETPVSIDDMIGHYKRSKFLAEEEVRGFVSRGLPVVIVNPSTPVGELDIKPTPTGKMILDAAAGRVPAFVDTGLNIVHVDDVAEGHALALERGRIGERYVLGGENMLLKDVLALVASVAGRKPPTIRLPEGVLWPAAFAMEKFADLTGIPPVMTRDHLKMARKKMFYSSAKAMRELGYQARPPREAVEDAVAWFRANGMLAG